ncbi:class III lanthipeptide [Chengkuizengella sediminis]|nr:class III lanthipeptide [Chengkuizengella sediminis]
MNQVLALQQLEAKKSSEKNMMPNGTNTVTIPHVKVKK